ncbi:hypothetical protein [Desulfotruncus alcoholivorax]|nr:hypothetical protein [Desulfotruncus alcoholivorax]
MCDISSALFSMAGVDPLNLASYNLNVVNNLAGATAAGTFLG